ARRAAGEALGAPRRARSSRPRRRPPPRRTGSSDGSARSLDAQAIQQALVAAPSLAHADVQLEMHAAVEQTLDLLARRGPDGADHPPAGADQDALLRLRLRPH